MKLTIKQTLKEIKKLDTYGYGQILERWYNDESGLGFSISKDEIIMKDFKRMESPILSINIDGLISKFLIIFYFKRFTKKIQKEYNKIEAIKLQEREKEFYNKYLRS